MASEFCTPPLVCARERVTVRGDEERKGEKGNGGKEEEGRKGVKNTSTSSTSSLFAGDIAFSVADLISNHTGKNAIP